MQPYHGAGIASSGKSSLGSSVMGVLPWTLKKQPQL